MPTRPQYFKPKHLSQPGQDQPIKIQENRPNAYQRGYDRDWRKLREQFLKDHPFCFACGSFAEAVDHRKPILQAPHLRLDESNLRAVCNSCHSIITQNYKNTGVNEMPKCFGKRARPN